MYIPLRDSPFALYSTHSLLLSHSPSVSVQFGTGKTQRDVQSAHKMKNMLMKCGN